LYRGVAQSEPVPRSVVYIDLLSPGSKSLEFASSLLDEDELMWSQRGCETVRICPHPRSFAEIDPTITFTSRSSVSGYSQFHLYENGELVHSESSELRCLGPLSGSEGFSLHRTSLMPGYWTRLAQVSSRSIFLTSTSHSYHFSDLSNYHIAHRVYDSEDDSERRLLFSTIYKFRYPPAALSYNAECYSPVSDDLDIAMDKTTGLDYSSFDGMLSLPSPADYSGARSFGEVASWNAYPSASFEPAH
jgi:transcriptional enhancer factor